jgi:hypothetical protein
MIKRAIFSYLNSEESFRNKGGFVRFGDLLFSTSLAVWCARQHFDEVIMVSTDWGIDLFKETCLPVTGYSNNLNQIKDISKYFWAYGKLIAYADQDVPFIHVDNDVFMWDKLPDRMLNAPLCFQSQEPFKLPGYRYYDLLKKSWKDAPIRPQKIVLNEVNDYAYNCGVCGGNKLEFFKEWKECSAEYIFAKENQEVFFKKHADILIHQNLFHEQYFAASLIKMHRLRNKVEVITPNVDNIPQKLKYTHLWGTTKRNSKYMVQVRQRLEMESQILFNIVSEFNLKHNI